MRINDSYLDALKALGYTETEARFLYIVATHSGYFVAQQFLDFASVQRGYRSNALAEKLFGQRHASAEIYRKNARVYHIFSRKIYAAIGKEDIRNRRKHEFSFIEEKLLALDFILTHQQHDYFETEADKLGYFCDRLGIVKEDLPAKLYLSTKRTSITSRYFVDKFPMFLSDAGTSSVVSFTYIASGTESLRAFASHLHRYIPLFRSLKRLNFLFLSPCEDLFPKACAIFSSLVKGPLESSPLTELTRCFKIRKLWDSKQFAGLKHEDVLFLNQAMRRFSGERFQSAYREWSSGALSDTDFASVFPDLSTGRQVDFDTCLVKSPRFLASLTDDYG